jgi:hypothetical protein
MIARPLNRVRAERERLRARIDSQRYDVERHFGGLEAPARFIDRVRQAGRFVRSHPGVVAAAAAGVFALRSRTILGLVARGAGLWRLARGAQALLRHVGR